MKIGHEVEGKTRGLKTLFLLGHETLPATLPEGIQQVYFGADKTRIDVKIGLDIQSKLPEGVLFTVEMSYEDRTIAYAFNENTRVVLRLETPSRGDIVLKVETQEQIFMFEDIGVVINSLKDPLFAQDVPYNA